MGFARVINACRTSSKIIIGQVQGKAVGGGVGVAAAVDYCLATTHAAFRLSELAVGIGPFVVGPVIERKIGLAAMSGLALTPARWYSAEWGQEKGLYAEVFENADQLDKGVKRLVAELLSYSSEAMSALKQAFWAGTDHWDALLEERASISGHLVLSPAARAAISAFKGK